MVVREGCVLVRCSVDEELRPVCATCVPRPYRTWARWTFPADQNFSPHKCHKCGQSADSDPLASGIAHVRPGKLGVKALASRGVNLVS